MQIAILGILSLSGEGHGNSPAAILVPAPSLVPSAAVEGHTARQFRLAWLGAIQSSARFA